MKLRVSILAISDRWSLDCSGIVMRMKRFGTWFLLGYLVLLLNLGPNAHRIQCLGLHSVNLTSKIGTKSPASCQCCHSPTDSKQTDWTSDIVHSFADCAFCKFFKHFQMVWQVFNFELQTDLLPGFERIVENSVEPDLFKACARGPPRVC